MARSFPRHLQSSETNCLSATKSRWPIATRTGCVAGDFSERNPLTRRVETGPHRIMARAKYSAREQGEGPQWREMVMHSPATGPSGGPFGP